MKLFFFTLSLMIFLPKPVLAEQWVTFWDMALTKEISEQYRKNGECRHSQIDLDSVYRKGNIAYYNKRHYYCHKPRESAYYLGEKLDCNSPWEQLSDLELFKQANQRLIDYVC
jgi:hypothetical protein